MATREQQDKSPVYTTITGRGIPLAALTEAESCFLERVAKKYNGRQDWTRFAAWWNAEFNAAGLSTSSVVYRLCQDLEARLGINQGKVSPPDYRDFLADLIETRFGSRQDFCRAAEVDPGQLSRVLANRGDLSMKVLQKVLEVLKAHLVIQTEEASRAQTSVDQAGAAIANALALRTHPNAIQPASADTPQRDLEQPVSMTILQKMLDEQLTPLREKVNRLESELHVIGAASK